MKPHRKGPKTWKKCANEDIERLRIRDENTQQ